MPLDLATLAIGAVVALLVALGVMAVLGKGGVQRLNVSKALKMKGETNFNIKRLEDDNPRVLHPLKWRSLKVEEVLQENHNTVRVVIKLPKPEDTAMLPIGRHLSVMAIIDGEKVIRPYTPVSHPAQEGVIELVVKVYATGAMSSHLASLKRGDTLDVRGPTGNFKHTPAHETEQHYLMLAAGSGLTPMLQVARCILEDGSGDGTQMTLFFQNRQARDILCQAELDALVAAHGDQLRIVYYLSRPSGSEKLVVEGEVRSGYIEEAHIGEVARHCGEGSFKVLVCGPAGFCDTMVEQCERRGIEKEQRKVF